MEHNFTFTSASEISLVRALINSIHLNDNKYNAMRSIVDFAPELPCFDDYDVNVGNLLDRLADALTKAEEDEMPKYEHRYSILHGSDGSVIREYDDLNEAFEFYTSCYDNDYTRFYCVDDCDYILHDNKLDIEVTDRVPYTEYEYEWSADISINLNGRTVYDPNDNVLEEVHEQISYGDCEGYVTDEIGSISWEDIEDWEEEHEPKQEETAEVSTDAVSDSTEETATEPDNTWHVY